jgi:hypothetical protein
MKGSLDDLLEKARNFPSTILLPIEIDTEDIKDRIRPEPSQVWQGMKKEMEKRIYRQTPPSLRTRLFLSTPGASPLFLFAAFSLGLFI